MSSRLLVIADDLTGATDAAAQFSERGVSARVVLWPDAFIHSPPARGDTDVLVANSESRHQTAATAAGTVSEIVRAGMRMGIRQFFKKTDSTLRGNIGAELEAALEAAGARLAPFVAASPALGRTTRQGIHYVHGVPLHQTEYGTDPLNPVARSEVAALLRAQCRLSINHFGRSESELSRFVNSPELRGIAVFDCETLEDYARIAAALAHAKTLQLCAGPAAFAGALTGVWNLPARARPLPSLRLPLLIVNGSLNPRALEQASAINALKISLTPEQLFTDHPLRLSFPQPLPNTILVQTVNSVSEAEAHYCYAQSKGLSRRQAHQLAAARLGEAARALLEQNAFGAVLVIGGDTLAGVARACNWAAFNACGEPIGGIAAVTADNFRPVILTKPGGFGETDILRRLAALF